MARLHATFWNRHKFKLSGLLLLLPVYYFYQSLHPQFPAALPTQQLGEFSITPMPLDNAGPYQHDGEYIKDFMVMFPKGDVSDIRQAFMNIGPKPLKIADLHDGELGILHGSRYGQHVHALAPAQLSDTDKLWLTVENWQGHISVTSWSLQ